MQLYEHLDQAITPEAELQQQLENATKKKASVLDHQAAHKAWLEHPITQTKIAYLKIQNENLQNSIFPLLADFETNKSKIQSYLTLVHNQKIVIKHLETEI